MDQSPPVLIVSATLDQGLELEERMWRAGWDVAVVTPEETATIFLHLLPLVVIIDARRCCEGFEIARRMGGRDDATVRGPRIIVITDIPRLVGWLPMPEGWVLATPDDLVREVLRAHVAFEA